MFSEYASRFLQQSNARLSFTQHDEGRSQNPLDRRRYVQRPGMPYRPPSSSQSRFAFASRLSRHEAHAPLFHSTTEDFAENNQDDEHEREVADLYALQRSRQHFGQSHLTESSEMEDDSVERIPGQAHDRDAKTYATNLTTNSKHPYRDENVFNASPQPQSLKGKGRMVDVNLASTINEEPPESLTNLSPIPDDQPAPFHTFRSFAKGAFQSSFMPAETDDEAGVAMPRAQSPERESIPPTVILPAQEPPRHDAFWASLFQISMFAMFAAFVLIWFHTSTPSSKNPIGDTIYSAIRASTNMLLWETFIAVIVGLIWLSLLRHYVRPLVYIILVAIPVVLFSFSLYPLINSYKGTQHGSTFQDRMMRWLSLVPAIIGVVWTYSIIRSRHSLARSISILEFSTKILAASPYLVMLGFATLGVVVIYTWIWMLMFERVFLSGHMEGAKRFLIDANSWWLGAFFVLEYLWSLGVIAGVQRATTAAVVSQWYFHRFTIPQPSSQQVVRASIAHATGALFGTICLSTFLSLLVRLPLIVLPGRISSLLNLCAYWVIPSSLATLTNPLTLTYGAIHSQPLGIAARGLGQLNFVSRTNPSNTLQPRNFHPAQGGSTLMPYRLAKLLLQATRTIMSLALGFSGWVRTAHKLNVSGASGVRGSLYAYVVGLIAATIGYAVLGAIENVVGAVVDAAVICWASETGGSGEARFCREAGELFGEDDRTYR